MIDNIRNFAVRKAARLACTARLACIWIETGNPTQPLVCRWIPAGQAASLVSAGADAADKERWCA